MIKIRIKEEIEAVLINTVVTMVVLTMIWTAGCQKPSEYTISGNITIINDCDGVLDSIPSEVRVTAILNDSRGNSIGDSSNVNLAPDPSGNPIKNGVYAISVKWENFLGDPTVWGRPDVRRLDKREICQPILCTEAGKSCTDRATKARKVPVGGTNTQYNIRISCACG
jgi:hypothetical protein